VSGTRYVRGLEFRPENPRVVHHANILLDRTPTSRQRNDEDPALGEQGLLAATAAYPPGHFLGWTPGVADPLLPPGLSWQLEPGTDLVVQLHLKPNGKQEAVRFSVGFYFGADPPGRTPAVLRLGRQDIDIPAGETRYTITDSYVLPVDVEVLALKPHAHARAREIRAVATLPGGATQWLLFIRDWDFGWQHTYRYTTPLALPRGTTVRMEYVYDNAAGRPRVPQEPPRPVRWGPRSSDEMGDLWIQALTRDEHDLETLNRDFRRKWNAEDAVGYERLLAADPGNVALHEDAALVYLELGRPADAVTHLDAAVRRKPASAAAHFNLGVALMLAGRSGDAIREYEEALRINPRFAAAHTSLGNVLADQGRLDDALAHYREAVRWEPRAGAHNNIGFILLGQGKPDEALPYFPRGAAARSAVAGRAFQHRAGAGSARGDRGGAPALPRRAAAQAGMAAGDGPPRVGARDGR
jgi:tetratricopeptide (TPR) repeat protein